MMRLLFVFVGFVASIEASQPKQWWEGYDAKNPPTAFQAPWASAPGFTDIPLPAAPRPMAPPEAPLNGFTGSGKFYPPAPPPPPSPPPPIPPPPPAPGASDSPVSFNLARTASPIMMPKAISSSTQRFKEDDMNSRFKESRNSTRKMVRNITSDTSFRRSSNSTSSVNLRGSSKDPMRFADTSLRTSHRAGASVGKDGERNLQWTYFDPKNPPSWMNPPWNGKTRQAQPPGAIPMP